MDGEKIKCSLIIYIKLHIERETGRQTYRHPNTKWERGMKGEGGRERQI